MSYRQIIFEYPEGGGAYIVGKSNLGEWPGLVAAAALMIDYVLTVAVSVAAGIAALTSAVPALLPHREALCVAAILLVTVVNLRGVRESGQFFAVPTYEKTLLKVCERGNIGLHFMVKLVAIDGPRKKATFIGVGEHNKDEKYVVDFDMIHVTPPQSAPDFIRSSKLANATGWVDVDKHSLQHLRYPHIFSLGDSSGLPTSKTGAAIRKQAPVLVANLLAAIEGKPFTASYNGYTSCPLVTAYGKLVLAEFDYDGKPQETFPFDQSKERRSMYWLKRYVLPWLYWSKILPGKA